MLSRSFLIARFGRFTFAMLRDARQDVLDSCVERRNLTNRADCEKLGRSSKSYHTENLLIEHVTCDVRAQISEIGMLRKLWRRVAWRRKPKL